MLALDAAMECPLHLIVKKLILEKLLTIRQVFTSRDEHCDYICDYISYKNF